MTAVNITFICENGHFKLEECTKVPTKKELEESFVNFREIGLGKIKKIIIDNIK